MRKFLISIILLAILDVVLLNRLQDIDSKSIEYEYNISNDSLLIQKKDVVLDDIQDFIFNDYFDIVSFNKSKYQYDFLDTNLKVIFNDKEYLFNYEINEPEVIEKIVYVSQEAEYQEPIESNDVYYYEDDYFYVIDDYMCFSIDTSIDEIRSCLQSNICTSVQTSIDYSSVNTSQYGQYVVFYISENEILEIIVEIM